MPSLFDTEEKVFTIAEYIEILNTFFKAKTVKITGEISEIKFPGSGHVYFTIKDKTGESSFSCIIWNRNYALCGVALEVGMEVILSGHPNIYPARGSLSFVADTVELVGEGALKKAYDALKKKLEAEGVFAPARKRALPEYVQKLGIITSMKGAVIHDFQNNLGKFGFKLNVLDSRVEGQQAVASLMASVTQMRGLAEAGGIEVLVIIRGGGSLESLQAFNNEALVRAIVDFPVPVVAGIGHDQDVPLMALAADFMTSTPTAAAHLLSRSWEEAYAKLTQVGHILTRVEQQFRRIDADLDASLSAVLDHTERRIKRAGEVLEAAERSVRVNDPTRQLKLGYAIVRSPDGAGGTGKIIRSVRDVKAGDELSAQLADGTIRTEVKNI